MVAASIAETLRSAEILYAPGVWDGMSARITEQAGFSALFSSGMAIAASLGMPDADIYTMTENLAAVRRIVEASSLPLIADADHGYGGPLNVMRTVRSFEHAGASAVIIEDQASPKRCPVCVDDPVSLVPIKEAVGRIRAACDARRRSDTLIVARTDALGTEALQRATAYGEAGADFIFPVSKTFKSVDEWQECRRCAGVPLLACLTTSTWVEREFDDETMRKIGVRIALLPFQAMNAAIGAMRNALDQIRAGTPPAKISESQLTHDQFRRFIDFDGAMAIERRYSG
jgi:methylisocitrate lyase